MISPSSTRDAAEPSALVVPTDTTATADAASANALPAASALPLRAEATRSAPAGNALAQSNDGRKSASDERWLNKSTRALKDWMRENPY